MTEGGGVSVCSLVHMKSDDVVDLLDATQSINQSIVIWRAPKDRNSPRNTQINCFSFQPQTHIQVPPSPSPITHPLNDTLMYSIYHLLTFTSRRRPFSCP